MPVASGATFAPNPFSPNGDAVNDTSTLSFNLSEAASVTAILYDAGNTAVRTLANGATLSAGANSLLWDGKNDAATVVPDGSYTVKIDATDAAGNKAGQITAAVVADIAPPAVASTYPSSGATGIPQDATITATFSEPVDGSTVTSATFTLDNLTSGGPVAGLVSYDAGTKTASFTPSAKMYANETYQATLSTAIKDLAGNPLAAVFNWSFTTKDTTPPTVLSLAPANTVSVPGGSVAITADAQDNVGVTKVEFYYGDNVPTPTWNLFAADTTAGDGWSGAWNTSGLADGTTYKVRALAYDAVGLTGELIYTYTVDKSPPVISGTAASPAAISSVNGGLATVTYSINEAAQVRLQVRNSSATLVYESVLTSVGAGSNLTLTWDGTQNYGGLSGAASEGTYSFTIVAIDLVNNTSQTAAGSVTVDNTPPAVTISSVSPAIFSATLSQVVTVTYTINDQANVKLRVKSGGTIVYETSPVLSVTGGSNRTITWDGIRNYGGLSGVAPDGVYSLEIVATDLQNNPSTSAAGDVTLDSTAPAVTVTSTTPTAFSPALAGHVTVTYDLGETAKVKLQVRDSSNTIVFETSPVVQETAGTAKNLTWNGSQNYGGLSGTAPDGSYSLMIVAADTPGNASTTTAGTVTLDGTSPAITVAPAASNLSGTGAIITWTTGEAATSKVEYGTSMSYGSSTTVDSTLVTSHSVNLNGLSPTTTYHYRVISGDAVGNTTTSGDYTFATTVNDTSPPNFRVYYYSDAGRTVLLKVINGTVATRPQTVYLKVVTDESIKAGTTPTFSIDAPGTSNDVSGGTTTSDGGSQTTFLATWNVLSGNPDGSATVTVSGSDPYNNAATNATPLEGGRVYIDSTAPVFLEARPINNTTVDAIFSDYWLDAATTDVTGGYSITPSLAVTSATLQSDGKTVRLKTAAQTNNTSYTLSVLNDGSLKDAAGNGFTGANTKTFSGTSALAETPHGYYISNTNLCVICHSQHKAVNTRLLNQNDIKTLCYLCHDPGGQSKYDVASEFGTVSPYATTHHKVPEGIQTCTDCHNPHDGGRDANGNQVHWPRLLQSFVDRSAHGGNQFCWTCHGSSHPTSNDCAKCHDPHNLGSSINGDHQTWYPGNTANASNPNLAGTGHDSASLNPPTGTGIKCSTCHQSHGSSLLKMFQTVVNGNTTTGNDNTQCQACHQNNLNTYGGATAYDASGHGTSTSTLAHNGVATPVGYCIQCHNPHGTANVHYTVGEEENLCYNCHSATSGVTGAVDIQSAFGKISHHKITATEQTAGSRVECVSCHNSHTVTATNKTSNPANTTAVLSGVDFCLGCHGTAGSRPAAGGTVPYTVSFEPRSITTNNGNNGDGWDKSTYKNSAHFLKGITCGDCHSSHGSDYSLLLNRPEDTDTVSGLCLSCHDGSRADAPNVKPDLTQTGSPSPDRYRHPTLYVSGQHSDTEDYATLYASGKRHAECVDCHDPHNELPRTTTVNPPAAPPPLQNVSGVEVTFGTKTWADWESTGPAPMTFIKPIQYQYQLCFKCHSSYAFGSNPPTPGGSIQQTDTPKEFNPNNPAYHAVVGTSKIQTFTYNSQTYYYGKFTGTDSNGNAMTATTRLYCEDCHRSSSSGLKGPHGSSYWYILRGPWTRSTGAEGIGGTGGPNTSNHLCFFCHDYNFYAAGVDGGSATVRSAFSNSSNYNLHRKHKERGCTSCHSAVPHGWKTRSLLTETTDPAPYSDGSWLKIRTWRSPGGWQQMDCDHSQCG
ncbi:MAG: Ig-like domain-containing protein [Firmicutes bacterium]|nr:Ig-like domain-containing protein [Bacillota bacterium]